MTFPLESLVIGHWGTPGAQSQVASLKPQDFLSLVFRTQILETIPFSSPRNMRNFFPNENRNLLGNPNRTSATRLFSFSLLRFFFLFVAKTKRKRNEEERRKVFDIPTHTRIQCSNKKETLQLFASVDPAVKPRDDEIVQGSSENVKFQYTEEGNPRFIIHHSSFFTPTRIGGFCVC